MPLRDIPHTPPRTLTLVSTHHRHLRSDPTKVWRGVRRRDSRYRRRGSSRDRFRYKVEFCQCLVEESGLEVYPPHCRTQFGRGWGAEWGEEARGGCKLLTFGKGETSPRVIQPQSET